MKTMTIDDMIKSLTILREKVGGDKIVPVVRLGCGENDYVIPEYAVLGDFEDQDGYEFKCALVGSAGGEEFSRKNVPHYEWKSRKDELKITKDLKTRDNILNVRLEGFYYEDAELNGEKEPEDRCNMPGYNGNAINWTIDIDTGTITNWTKGLTARVWYKVVDEFSYNYNEFFYGPNYVPGFMSIDDDGFGDYVYLTIESDGKIKNWSKDRFLKEHNRLVKESEDD